MLTVNQVTEMKKFLEKQQQVSVIDECQETTSKASQQMSVYSKFFSLLSIFVVL